MFLDGTRRSPGTVYETQSRGGSDSGGILARCVFANRYRFQVSSQMSEDTPAMKQ